MGPAAVNMSRQQSSVDLSGPSRPTCRLGCGNAFAHACCCCLQMTVPDFAEHVPLSAPGRSTSPQIAPAGQKTRAVTCKIKSALGIVISDIANERLRHGTLNLWLCASRPGGVTSYCTTSQQHPIGTHHKHRTPWGGGGRKGGEEGDTKMLTPLPTCAL